MDMDTFTSLDGGVVLVSCVFVCVCLAVSNCDLLDFSGVHEQQESQSTLIVNERF